MDDPLYKCFKQMENAAQGMMFTIPQPDSDAFNALELAPHESWKLGCLVEMLIWFRDKTAASANRVFLQGRGD